MAALKRRRRPRLLLVEDSEAIRKSMMRWLKREYQVTAVETGEEAVSLISSERFDLVLSDFNLAGIMTGGDLYSWLARHGSELASRFVLHSAADPAQMPDTVRLLEKPVSPTELRQALSEVGR